MMGNKQDQIAEGGSTAIQAARDVNFHGVSPGQMLEILDAVSTQVSRLSEVATKSIDERLTYFKESILDRFQNDRSARPGAFAEPDFQAALLDAQKAYARSGDDGLHGVLVDLIAERSKQETRNRLTLTLNDAIQKSSSITEEDFAALSLIFAMKHGGGILNNLDELVNYFLKFLDPFLDLAPKNLTSYAYLESHGCLTLSMVAMHNSYFELLKIGYPGVVTKGLTVDEMSAHLPSDHLARSRLVISSEFDPNLEVIFPASKSSLDALAKYSFLPNGFSDMYFESIKDRMPTEDEFIDIVGRKYPRLQILFDAFANTSIKTARLTPLGIALAHANLVRKTSGVGNLSMWIE